MCSVRLGDIHLPSGISLRENPPLTSEQGRYQTFPWDIWLHISATTSLSLLPSLENEAKKRCVTLEKAMQGGAVKTNHLRFEKTSGFIRKNSPDWEVREGASANFSSTDTSSRWIFLFLAAGRCVWVLSWGSAIAGAGNTWA